MAKMQVGKGPGGASSPMNARAKSTQNPSGQNASYGPTAGIGPQGNKGLNKGGTPPMHAIGGGLNRPGKSPGTPAVSGSTQVPKFTSNPFVGRSNMGAGSSGMSGNAKAWANKKTGNRP